jgi:hypothetical protein
MESLAPTTAGWVCDPKGLAVAASFEASANVVRERRGVDERIVRRDLGQVLDEHWIDRDWQVHEGDVEVRSAPLNTTNPRSSAREFSRTVLRSFSGQPPINDSSMSQSPEEGDGGQPRHRKRIVAGTAPGSTRPAVNQRRSLSPEMPRRESEFGVDANGTP